MKVKFLPEQKKGLVIIPSRMCIACGQLTYKNGVCGACGYLGG